MPMVRAVLGETARTFDLRGRTARVDYLWFLASAVVLYAATIAVFIVMLPVGKVAAAIYFVTALFYLPVTAAGVRRLHDIGESGSLMLDPLKPAAGFFIVLAVLWLLASGTYEGTVLTIFAAFFFAKAVIAVLVIVALFVLVLTLMYFSNTMGLLLLLSQPGPNKYGPNPHEVNP